ncbi:hypothetical protein ACHWQZ_G006442 [Mnemiopsis leidyi]
MQCRILPNPTVAAERSSAYLDVTEDAELLTVTTSPTARDVTSSAQELMTSPDEQRRVMTRRRVEANKTLPSCRDNPSTLNRRRKPLSEQILELREEKKKERARRRKRWCCCHRLFHWVISGVKAAFVSCGESVRWTFRGACHCTCSCEIWGDPIGRIQGYLGSHISTYFKALVWLLKINLICMVLGLVLIVSPSAFVKSESNDTTIYNRDSRCYPTNIVQGNTKASRALNSIIQFFTGTGWMENTPVFIGWYPQGKVWTLDLAYLYTGVVIAYFILSLVVISSNVSTLFNRSAVETVGFKPYSDLIFNGWDFSIKTENSSVLKRVTLNKSLKEQLAKDAQRAQRRSVFEDLCVGSWRVFTNFLCLGAMAVFFWVLIVHGGLLDELTVTETCNMMRATQEDTSMVYEKLQQIWSTYSASIIMAVGNTVYPLFFKFLGAMEFYKLDSNRVVITMMRSLVMKLATICTLLFLMYQEVKSSASPPDPEYLANMQTISDFNCWENHLAAKIYQLWIIHHLIFWVYTALKKVFSVALRELFKINFITFDITEEILDLCYKQMIVWSLFPIAPLMTIVAVFETVIVFYIKRWVAMGYQTRTMILTSQTVNVVNALFLLSLVAIFAFYGIVVSNFAPSQYCTPFRGQSSFSDLFQDITAPLGVVQDYIIMTLKSITATIIIIVVFSLILYYYKCAGSSKNVKIKLLEERIKWEQKDKAFLLAKLSKKSPRRNEILESERSSSLSN